MSLRHVDFAACNILTSFRLQDKPTYHPGLYACITCCLFTLLIVSLITLRSWSLNKRADRGELELEFHDVSFALKYNCCRILMRTQETDQKGFRYTY